MKWTQEFDPEDIDLNSFKIKDKIKQVNQVLASANLQQSDLWKHSISGMNSPLMKKISKLQE